MGKTTCLTKYILYFAHLIAKIDCGAELITEISNCACLLKSFAQLRQCFCEILHSKLSSPVFVGNEIIIKYKP